ncbi:MAG: polyribonucleotide nucleotidyltransferase [Candidatus Buchananbacteria bacterium CG10_big_fil_rev_8_21_14_0_10_42_9]|uniref:Polyribonucleotide nucleotidyltransferase n=1 Tax=Candidatus Buchananbacteria bacterium CG10_big_fil_rev_8_21_14_0_10_42_9 TaxID=1974526 RepID=A0A2H0W291_9BACT|nr:MAG: polyribonucleotide nucleotidyltransferase [Candidatus Buchananbacteria bacterium CG10_big_fil_rev_8_21_14_0_10_42_9]
MEVKKYETSINEVPLVLEFGVMAKQATASCTVRYGDTMVLATVVISETAREGIDFFPLSVEYEERLYAAGKIKGSRWIKREGKPTDEAVLSARLVDRAIRPLFPDYIKNEVQVIFTVLSYDGENDPDIAAMIGASAILSASPIPWDGPIAGTRIGILDEQLIINPKTTQIDDSTLDVYVASKAERVIMLEAGAKEIPEEKVAEAIELAIKTNQPLVKLINKIQSEIGETKLEASRFSPAETGEAKVNLNKLVDGWIKSEAKKVLYSSTTKQGGPGNKELIAILKDKLAEYLVAQEIDPAEVKNITSQLKWMLGGLASEMILKEGKRVDGRALDEIRPLGAQVALLPRTHGSGLFNRGETQVLSIVTLGSPGDKQQLDGMEESGSKRYMHHYNFPPFSVGEAKPMRFTSRREIGHGALAERALEAVLPPESEFPYTIRVVSETLGSNGSSSMASTCGSTLALMDAGVPITKPVAGIAMGIATDDQDNYKILTDLQDVEDGDGGMDFKITGTADGVTAIQLDLKNKGLTMAMINETFVQAKKARMEILDVMQKAIPEVRQSLSIYAPRIETIHIDQDQIRDVIGPGGKVINEIIDATGVDINIEQDGTVTVTSVDPDGMQKALDWIRAITRKVEVGDVFDDGKVTRLMDFGAFVEVLPGKEGLVHVSEMAWHHVDTPGSVLKVGDTVKVQCIKIDEQGRINLSMKALLPKPEGYKETDRPNRDRKDKRFNNRSHKRPFKR